MFGKIISKIKNKLFSSNVIDVLDVLPSEDYTFYKCDSGNFILNWSGHSRHFIHKENLIKYVWLHYRDQTR